MLLREEERKHENVKIKNQRRRKNIKNDEEEDNYNQTINIFGYNIFKNFVSIVLNELRMLINLLILLSKYCFCCFNKFIEDNNLECLELKLGSVWCIKLLL